MGMTTKLQKRQKRIARISLIEDKKEEKSCRIPITNIAPNINGFVKGFIVDPKTGNCSPKSKIKNIAAKNQLLKRKSLRVWNIGNLGEMVSELIILLLYGFAGRSDSIVGSSVD